MTTNRRTKSSAAILSAGVAVGLVLGLAGPAVGSEVRTVINGHSIKPHTIAGNRLKNHTVTPKQLKNKLVWHPLALQNSWGPQHTSGQYVPAYAVSSEGIVYLRGRIGGGTSGSVAFTLPAGARPGFEVDLNVGTFRTTTGMLYISTTGAVTAANGFTNGDAGDATVLDGVSFSAGA